MTLQPLNIKSIYRLWIVDRRYIDWIYIEKSPRNIKTCIQMNRVNETNGSGCESEVNFTFSKNENGFSSRITSLFAQYFVWYSGVRIMYIRNLFANLPEFTIKQKIERTKRLSRNLNGSAIDNIQLAFFWFVKYKQRRVKRRRRANIESKEVERSSTVSLNRCNVYQFDVVSRPSITINGAIAPIVSQDCSWIRNKLIVYRLSVVGLRAYCLWQHFVGFFLGKSLHFQNVCCNLSWHLSTMWQSS